MGTTQDSTANSFTDMERWLKRQWFSLTCWQSVLWPLSQLFRMLSVARKLLYRVGVLRVWHAPVPVIVVGNISVGGTGKTPLTLWLARFLKENGYHPGIVSRGYGGRASGAQAVDVSSRASDVGDEPLLLARRSGCPVWVGRNRPLAAGALFNAHPECDVLICDDGLQHYALARDVEIAVGGVRSLGNGRLIPAGPLRERASRLEGVDIVVANGEEAVAGEFSMRLAGSAFRNLQDTTRISSASDFQGLDVHAVAGIGQPQRFFDTLHDLGLACKTRTFPDHYAYRLTDLEFGAQSIILMTEKDAVKCMDFARPNWWYLEVDAQLDDAFGMQVLKKLRSRNGRKIT